MAKGTMQIRREGKNAGMLDKQAGRNYGYTKNPYNFVTQNNSHTHWKNGYREGYNSA